jgi:phospholipase C
VREHFGQVVRRPVANHVPQLREVAPPHDGRQLVCRTGDAANHQYDLADFVAVADAGHFPQVAFLKPPAYQNGHAGYSDPIDEQAFVVRVLNDLQQRPEWTSTAVILTWDDSDGWYDHRRGIQEVVITSLATMLVGAVAIALGWMPAKRR